jgi:superfamily II DNA or RNA helicase
MSRKTQSRKTVSPRGKSMPSASGDLNRLEFHRHGAALMPAAGDRFPAIAYLIKPPGNKVGQRFCDCTDSGRKTCGHLKQLSRISHGFQDAVDLFQNSQWYRLATIMADGRRQPLEKVRILAAGEKGRPCRVVVEDGNGDKLLQYISKGSDFDRFIDRCTLTGDDAAVPTRADILQRLALMTCTDDEIFLMEKGLETKRQTFEKNFWYRFAYHCFREFGETGCALRPSIDETDGTFYISGMNADPDPLFHLPIPRQKVKRILDELSGLLSNQHGLNISPLHLDSVFNVKLNQDLDLEIQPMLRLIQKDGMHKFFRREDLDRYKYGDIYFIKELGMLVEDMYPAPPPELSQSATQVVQKSQVPFFLSETDLSQDYYLLDDSVGRLRIMDTFDRIEITAESIEMDWCWLSAIYGDGCQSVSLADVIQAKRNKERFVATDNGWVDCQSSAFTCLDPLAEAIAGDARTSDSQTLRIPRRDVLRLIIQNEARFSISGDSSQLEAFEHLLSLKSLTPMPRLEGMRSSLRTYQQRGAEWLWFLYENGFGGLLCDDMGLGKTHQVMALFVALNASERGREPFLVVCPTSVISHWEQKIGQHAPGLTAKIYHGGERDLAQDLNDADVLITSYGIMRRDQEALASIPLSIAVFDEIQHVKNPDTFAYKAAVSLQAKIKLGLTGTPIENRLDELKALFDITVPGYLGSDEAFLVNYQTPIEKHDDPARRKQLSRLISPFMLRRLKKTVLEELPPKFEDLRTCYLSEEQVKLYRDAIASRGSELIRTLEQENAPVPYMHIFALLDMLKQICNHPALVANDATDYAMHQSGKWELFVELLTESLDSGQKVVVYSQYLKMIEIIKQFLSAKDIGYAAITGASRNRGETIKRFNQDPDCRVFVGSLKAGGVGIDLVAASVVIHYDRWWNAAREDQATDRVHRIGQTRGVQVFKLVTAGTLEEKIAAIILKKRDLMDSIIKEDNPDLVKTFSRRHLIDMLTLPVHF